MVKVIAGSGAALGIGHDRNWNLDESALDRVCESYGISMSRQLRDELRLALFAHLSLGNLERQRPNARQTLAQVDKLVATSGLLHSELEEASQNSLGTIAFTLSTVGFTASKLEALRLLLQDFENSAKYARDQMSQNVEGGPGPRKYPHFDGFVLKLADIFERAGGTASAAYSPNYPNEYAGFGARTGPFVRFVSELGTFLPEELHLPDIGLGDSINRTLKSRRT